MWLRLCSREIIGHRTVHKYRLKELLMNYIPIAVRGKINYRIMASEKVHY